MSKSTIISHVGMYISMYISILNYLICSYVHAIICDILYLLVGRKNSQELVLSCYEKPTF